MPGRLPVRPIPLHSVLLKILSTHSKRRPSCSRKYILHADQKFAVSGSVECICPLAMSALCCVLGLQPECSRWKIECCPHAMAPLLSCHRSEFVYWYCHYRGASCSGDFAKSAQSSRSVCTSSIAEHSWHLLEYIQKCSALGWCASAATYALCSRTL